MKTRHVLFYVFVVLTVWFPGIAHPGDDRVSGNSEYREASEGDAELAVVQEGSPDPAQMRQEALISALSSLTLHISGDVSLDPSGIAQHKSTIDANKDLFGASRATIAASFKLVKTYDTEVLPFFDKFVLNSLI